MGDDRRLAGKVKGQITRFCKRISAGLCSARGRLVHEMIYGIQACEDVKLSNVCRSLNEAIPLIKTETRLSRNLAQEDLTEPINESLLRQSAHRIGTDTVLALDLGDIKKKYGRKMEHLAEVWDGSEGEVSRGYWLCEVIGADVDGSRIVPLYSKLYSQEAEQFVSENEEILDAVDAVRGHLGTRGIWAIDRGGDREKLLVGLIGRSLRFVVRQRGDRHLLTRRGQKKPCEEIARKCAGRVKVTVEVERDGVLDKKQLRLGSAAVRLPQRPDEQLWLVVIRGWGQEPMMLLTNVEAASRRGDLMRIMEVYLTRWKCEESYRFIKQAYGLEDVRVRSYVALRNVVVLVHAVFWFVSVQMGQSTKVGVMVSRLFERAQRFFEIPEFFCYALADGIAKVLSKLTVPLDPPGRPITCYQRYLPLFAPP